MRAFHLIVKAFREIGIVLASLSVPLAITLMPKDIIALELSGINTDNDWIVIEFRGEVTRLKTKGASWTCLQRALHPALQIAKLD